jgi:DNA-nicking Smr family endonuclease
MNDNPPWRRHRPLSESERVLWGEVTRGIRPLRARIDDARLQEPSIAQEAQPERQKRSATSARGFAKPPRPPDNPVAQPPPLAPLGRRLRQLIGRSRREIAARIDLHGLTQREAHDQLLAFLRAAQARGGGVVLVITGKGAAGMMGHGARMSGEGARGVLRRQVPHWLRLAQFRDLIVGFETAHAAHGGEGALYVQVRRRRS